MTDAYDLRSNIKGKPGSQGTLFQVKDKGLLNPQQRWPQGYTPERLNETRDALKSTSITGPDHLYDQPDSETQQMHGVNTFGYRERVTREIAKTTIPPEHLQGLQRIHGKPDEDTLGTYWKGGPNDRTIGVDMTTKDPDRLGRKPLYGQIAQTLTHEIGHHVNMTLAPTPHVKQLVADIHAHKDAEARGTTPTATDKAMQYSRVKSGVDEAQADDYLVEHHRTGGRKSQPVTQGRYEGHHTEQERADWYPGYNEVRPPADEHGPTWHAMQEAQFQPGLFPKSRAEGGMRAKIGAHADANRQALAAHIAAARGTQT